MNKRKIGLGGCLGYTFLIAIGIALLVYILSISLVLGGLTAAIAGIAALVNQELIPERFRKWTRYPVALIVGGLISFSVGVTMFSSFASNDESTSAKPEPITLSADIPNEVPKTQETISFTVTAKGANEIYVAGKRYKSSTARITDYKLIEGMNIIKVSAYTMKDGIPLATKNAEYTVYRRDPQVKLDISQTQIKATKNKTTISGSTEPGAKVSIILDGKKINAITADSKGAFSLETPSDKDYTYIVKAEKSGFRDNQSNVSVYRVLSPEEEKAEYKRKAKEIPYNHLKKNPDKYAGQIYKARGQIVQIMENNGVTIIRLSVTKKSYGWSFNDIVYVEYLGTTDFVEEDVVTVYGGITGETTYTSQAGWNITIPSVVAKYIEK